MKSIVLYVTLILSLFITHNAWSSCTSNNALKTSGFKVYTHNFKSYYAKAINYYHSHPDLFENDLDDVIFSRSANTLVHVQSYDALNTPKEIMWGDLVVMRDWRTGEKIEVRWFDNKGKHVAYNKSYQLCATSVIPMAFNSLF